MINSSIRIGGGDDGGTIIRHMTIERLTGLDKRHGTTDHDEWHTYYWTMRKGPNTHGAMIRSGTLEHRYGDGSTILVEKVLIAFNHLVGPDFPEVGSGTNR